VPSTSPPSSMQRPPSAPRIPSPTGGRGLGRGSVRLRWGLKQCVLPDEDVPQQLCVSTHHRRQCHTPRSVEPPSPQPLPRKRGRGSKQGPPSAPRIPSPTGGRGLGRGSRRERKDWSRSAPQDEDVPQQRCVSTHHRRQCHTPRAVEPPSPQPLSHKWARGSKRWLCLFEAGVADRSSGHGE